jgi:hypothetical protein
MGFRQADASGRGGYGRIWSIKREEKYTYARYSTSKKNGDEYETDFSGYIRLIGDAHRKFADVEAPKIEKGVTLKKATEKFEKETGTTFKGIPVQLTSVDVTNSYDKEKEITYTNFIVWDLELQDSGSNKTASKSASKAKTSKSSKAKSKKENFDNETLDDDLPF